MAPSSGDIPARPQSPQITTVFVLPDGMVDSLTAEAKDFIESYCRFHGVLVDSPLQNNGTDSARFFVRMSGSTDHIQHVREFIMDFVRSEIERHSEKTNSIPPAPCSPNMEPVCPVKNLTPAVESGAFHEAVAHDKSNIVREAVAHGDSNTGREAVAHDDTNTSQPRIDHDYPSTVPYEDPALLPGATGNIIMGEWGPRLEIDPEVWKDMSKKDRKRARAQMNRKYNTTKGPHQTAPTNPNNPNYPAYDPRNDERAR